jgi:hypothetical protein
MTLRQVAYEIPANQQGVNYKTYFVDSLHDWNDSPLYILDEASAFAAGLQYHVDAGTKDSFRLQSAKEFVGYVWAVVKAVKKHDPGYAQLPLLEGFAKWHEERIKRLTGERPTPPPYVPPPYIIRG